MAGKGYAYEVSRPAAYIFLALFAITFVWQMVYFFRKRAWFMWVLALATLMEVVGYASRLKASKDHGRTARIISETMLVSAPAFFAAQDYMIVGRMIAYIGGNLSLVRDTWITKIFVTADVITILTQVVGIVILVNGF